MAKIFYTIENSGYKSIGLIEFDNQKYTIKEIYNFNYKPQIFQIDKDEIDQYNISGPEHLSKLLPLSVLLIKNDIKYKINNGYIDRFLNLYILERFVENNDLKETIRELENIYGDEYKNSIIYNKIVNILKSKANDNLLNNQKENIYNDILLKLGEEIVDSINNNMNELPF